MKVVLFCGGQGLRMRGVVEGLPKPMVPLGGRPILWHVMKYYAHWGHTDFILCLGHKGETIKEFFVDYKEWVSNDFVLSGGRMELLGSDIQDWRITLVDTGQDACIGERLVAVREHLRGEAIFLASYADGLTDYPLPTIIDRLAQTDSVGVMLTARPNAAFHLVEHGPGGRVQALRDVEQAGLWINGGFFAFRQELFEYIRPGEELVLQPFSRLIEQGRLLALPCTGFWRCCDTFKDLQTLQALRDHGPAPWELWRLHPPGEGPAALPPPAAQPALIPGDIPALALRGPFAAVRPAAEPALPGGAFR